MSTTCKNTVITPLIPSKPRLRFMTDAAAGAAGGDAAAQQAASAAAAQAVADKAAADAAAIAAKPPWGDDPTKFDPDKAWSLIQNVRGDVEKQRIKFEADLANATTTAAAQGAKDALAGIAKLLAGEAPVETDPVKLQAKVTELTSKVSEQDTTLTTAQAAAKAGAISTQVAILAHGLGGSPKLLLANEKFKASIASVEPTDEAAITAIITAELQDNPALKATPPSSGSDGHQGGQIPNLEALLATAQKNGDVAESVILKRRIAAAKATP